MLKYCLLFFLLSSAFRHEIILAVLRCVESLVLCFSKRRQELPCLTVNSVHVTFKQIWTSTLRIIGIKRLTDCAFSLLTSLLKVQGVNFTLTYTLKLRLLEAQFSPQKMEEFRGKNNSQSYTIDLELKLYKNATYSINPGILQK